VSARSARRRYDSEVSGLYPLARRKDPMIATAKIRTSDRQQTVQLPAGFEPV
jgi:hypothetical protein